MEIKATKETTASSTSKVDESIEKENTRILKPERKSKVQSESKKPTNVERAEDDADYCERCHHKKGWRGKFKGNLKLKGIDRASDRCGEEKEILKKYTKDDPKKENFCDCSKRTDKGSLKLGKNHKSVKRSRYEHSKFDF